MEPTPLKCSYSSVCLPRKLEIALRDLREAATTAQPCDNVHGQPGRYC